MISKIVKVNTKQLTDRLVAIYYNNKWIINIVEDRIMKVS